MIEFSIAAEDGSRPLQLTAAGNRLREANANPLSWPFHSKAVPAPQFAQGPLHVPGSPDQVAATACRAARSSETQHNSVLPTAL